MLMFTGQNIRDLREALGLTATQLAVKLNVTENAVRRWEMGDRHPRYETLVKLNDLLKEAQKKGFVLEPA